MSKRRLPWTKTCDEWFDAFTRASDVVRESVRPLLLGGGLAFHIADAALRGIPVDTAAFAYSKREGHVLDQGNWRSLTSEEARRIAQRLLDQGIRELKGRVKASYERHHPVRTTLDALLRRHHVTIAALARARGVAYSAAHKVVMGQQQLTRPTADAWCQALRELGIEAEWQDLM